MTGPSSRAAEAAGIADAGCELQDTLGEFRAKLEDLDYLTIQRLHCYEVAPRVLRQSLRKTLHLAPPASRSLFRLLYFDEQLPVPEVEALLGAGLCRRLERVGILFRPEPGRLASRFRLELIGESLLLTDDIEGRSAAVYYGEDSQFLRHMLDPRPGERCLDLCTGTGVQGLRCAQVASRVDLVDVHPPAVRLARLNAALNGVAERVEVLEGDLWDAVPPDRRYDLVTCNPPLMPVVDEVPYPLFGHGGPDGLRVVRRVLAGLREHLGDAGRLLLIGACTGDERRPDILPAVAELLGDRFQSKLFLPLRVSLRDWVQVIARTVDVFHRDLGFENALLRSRVAYAGDSAKTYVYTYLLQARVEEGGDCRLVDYSSIGQRSYWFVNRGVIAE